MFDELLAFEKLEDGYEEMYGFYGVVMKRDFGPLKKDQRIEGSMWFLFETGNVVIEDADGNETLRFPFRIEA